MKYAIDHNCKNLSGRQNPKRAPLQWNDITVLIMSRSATAMAPLRIMCQVETSMEKQAMSEQHMHHTEWNYIIWLTLFRWWDRISKLQLQTALVNSVTIITGHENISFSDKFWMSVKLDRHLFKWFLGFSYAVQDIIKWNSCSTNPLSHRIELQVCHGWGWALGNDRIKIEFQVPIGLGLNFGNWCG